jgi:hypothetical protein
MTLRSPQVLRPLQDLTQARARRALVIDVVLAAVIAAIALSVAAGLGVIAFFGVPILLVLLLWMGIEKVVRYLRRRRGNMP